MAKFKITPTTTVAELKEQFRNEVGCVLRVYQGRSEAPDGATLVSLGAKEGELECRTSRIVGKFEEAFQNELNLKVKVYTKDNWVKVLDGITLAVAGQLPNGMTKAKMEEHLSYKRDEADNAEVVNEKATESVEVPNKFKGLPLVDLSFSKLEMTDDEIEDNSDELDVPGVVVAYAYDEGDDFEATAMVGSSIYDKLVDDCREWENGYGGRRIEYYISTLNDTYGFSEDIDEDVKEASIQTALCQYVGDYGYNEYELESPILIRAKWDDHTDIFSVKANGYFDNSWNLDEEFSELIRLTLAGKNVKEFPAIPLYKGVFVDINVDDLLTISSEELIERIREDVSWAKYAGAIVFKCSLKDGNELEICITEKDANVAFDKLKDTVKTSGSEIDWCDYAHILIDVEGFNPDGSAISHDKAIDMVCQLKMREERFHNLPNWTGEACFFYSAQQRRRGAYPTLLQYDNNGEEVELDIEMEEAEEKFDLNSEE